MQDYWWVTRPKRKLNSIPEELAAFCATALDKKWTHNRDVHIEFEEELETTGTKRVGERRDASGSGGRTHAAMLYSLGLWFEKNNKVFLTLAGEAIMNGKELVPVLKKQVLRFQYPSAYSDSVKVSPRFRIRPYIFLLRLLMDDRIQFLEQKEIALIVAIFAENETERCFNDIVERILRYRSYGEASFENDFLEQHEASQNNLMDVANTMMNWLDYTQLVYREKGIIGIASDKKKEVVGVLSDVPQFIQYPCEPDVYQRKYGTDPWHQKDTRNILNTATITAASIDKNRILRAFFLYSSLRPVRKIDNAVVSVICENSGTEYEFTQNVLEQTYPHGALGGYLINYRNMAFQGRDEAVDFEKATTNLFQEVLGYKAIHLGQTGAKSAPDVLLVSDEEGYQAIIDNKAYSKYSITGDHHNRMVHNYLEGINRYSECKYPIGYFTYISGGFISTIDSQIRSEVKASGVHGSGITVSNLIQLIENHNNKPYTHSELRQIFGIDRQILLSDLEIR